MAYDPKLTAHQSIIEEVQLMMGYGMIDLDLDPKHYEVALRIALDRYRQRSGNAMEESFLFLDVQPDVAAYELPAEVQEVRYVYRRGYGGAGGGANVDPFSLGFINNMYLMQNPGGMGNSGTGMLATYDLAVQFQNLAGRMFGRDVMYTYDPSTKVLTLERRFGAVEQIALHVYNTRPETVLLGDPYARPWLRDWTVAVCKMMLGEARSKFSTIAGPQGGFSLNGDALKTEARAEFDRLDLELTNFVDQHIGWPMACGD
jgi:hypothetical protein